jgi:peptidoglycan hydrolase CwlO-like protein
MLRLYLLIFIMGFIGSASYGAYWYYNDTQQRIATLRENNTKLQSAAETLQATIDTISVDNERNTALNQELTKQLQAAEGGLDRLRRRLSQIDLTQEALTDPADLERRIDRGVERLINDFKNDTSTEPSTYD